MRDTVRQAPAPFEGAPADAPPATRHELEVSVRTIVRLLVAALLVWSAVKLWPRVVLMLFSILIAVTLSPAIAWLERRRVPRAAAVLLIGVAFFAVVGGIATLVVPKLSEELSVLVQSLPRFERNVQAQMPAGHPLLHKAVTQVFALPASPEVMAFLARPLVWGRAAVELAAGGLLLVVLSLYLLLDGRRLYAWLLAYVPRRHRLKMAETAPEVEKVITAYMLGQLVTSGICAGFCFALLSLFHVPAALPLALLAGVCDVLPVVGIVISTIPAAFLALTVSPSTALAVLGGFLAYHAFETYLLAPRVYGRRLRLSTLAVLIALVVGGTLQGIVGAILVLPLVAAYPVIERIWLHDYLGPQVVRDHTVLAEAAENGTGSHAVDAVLRGDRASTAGR